MTVLAPADPAAALRRRRPSTLRRWRTSIGAYRRIVGARIRADWQYRTSFLLYVLGQAVASGLDTAALLVVFSQVPELAGWRRDEVLLLLALSGIAFGLSDLLVSPVEFCSRHIVRGTFDQFLLRPLSPMLQICGHEFALRRIGRMVPPLVLLVVTLPSVAVDWTVAHVVLVPVTLLSGFVIFSAIWVLTSSLAFWTAETQEVANSFTYGGSVVAHHPLGIYDRWLQGLVVFVVPLAFTSYLPTCVLLGRRLPLGMPAAVGYASPLVALASAGIAAAVWRVALRRHRSTGS